MVARRFVNFCIMLLVAAGLLLAPLAAPVMATVLPSATGMTDHALPEQAKSEQAMSDHAMSEQDMADMPCCPDPAKRTGCDDCPFLALCMLSVSPPLPAGAMSLIARDPLRGAFAAHDDRLLDGLGAKPPDHPPRTSV
jgi:hypothetical protein